MPKNVQAPTTEMQKIEEEKKVQPKEGVPVKVPHEYQGTDAPVVVNALDWLGKSGVESQPSPLLASKNLTWTLRELERESLA
ncbi:MAG: hypothetical protein QW035_03125 [Candidatus Anstonellales archaeon]